MREFRVDLIVDHEAPGGLRTQPYSSFFLVRAFQRVIDYIDDPRRGYFPPGIPAGPVAPRELSPRQQEVHDKILEEQRLSLIPERFRHLY